MKLGRLQWLTLAGISALFSLLCIGRVAYMIRNNQLLGRTVYVGGPFERVPQGTDTLHQQNEPTREELDKLSPRERRRRIAEEVRRRADAAKPTPGVIRKPWSESFRDHEYDWEEMAPWIFSGVLFAGVSVFLFVTATAKTSPPAAQGTSGEKNAG